MMYCSYSNLNKFRIVIIILLFRCSTTRPSINNGLMKSMKLEKSVIPKARNYAPQIGLIEIDTHGNVGTREHIALNNGQNVTKVPYTSEALPTEEPSNNGRILIQDMNSNKTEEDLSDRRLMQKTYKASPLIFVSDNEAMKTDSKSDEPSHKDRERIALDSDQQRYKYKIFPLFDDKTLIRSSQIKLSNDIRTTRPSINNGLMKSTKLEKSFIPKARNYETQIGLIKIDTHGNVGTREHIALNNGPNVTKFSDTSEGLPSKEPTNNGGFLIQDMNSNNTEEDLSGRRHIKKSYKAAPLVFASVNEPIGIDGSKSDVPYHKDWERIALDSDQQRYMYKLGTIPLFDGTKFMQLSSLIKLAKSIKTTRPSINNGLMKSTKLEKAFIPKARNYESQIGLIKIDTHGNVRTREHIALNSGPNVTKFSDTSEALPTKEPTNNGRFLIQDKNLNNTEEDLSGRRHIQKVSPLVFASFNEPMGMDSKSDVPNLGKNWKRIALDSDQQRYMYKLGPFPIFDDKRLIRSSRIKRSNNIRNNVKDSPHLKRMKTFINNNQDIFLQNITNYRVKPSAKIISNGKVQKAWQSWKALVFRNKTVDITPVLQTEGGKIKRSIFPTTRTYEPCVNDLQCQEFCREVFSYALNGAQCETYNCYCILLPRNVPKHLDYVPNFLPQDIDN